MLIQAFVISRFFYCPIIWMFCNKQSLALINKVHQRALRTQFMRFDLSLEELLQLSGRVSIHTKHLQALLTEIYKFLNKLNPSFMWNLFELKRTKYNLKSLNCLKLPEVKTRKFGIKSVIFRGSLLWNSIPNEIKSSTSLIEFKRKKNHGMVKSVQASL